MSAHRASLPVLPFHRKAAKELTKAQNRFGMVLLGTGLGLPELLQALLEEMDLFPSKELCTKLVLIISASSAVQQALPLPCLTAETSIQDREALMCKGGAFYVTSRIVLSDFLSGRLAPSTVNAMIDCQAHRLCHSFSLEAFCLHLYLEDNYERGSIKALSDSPEKLTTYNVEKILTTIGASSPSNLLRAPRFSALVKSDLDSASVQTVEVIAEPSAGENRIFRSLRDLCEAILAELARDIPRALIPAGTPEEWLRDSSREEALRSNVNPTWQSLAPRTRSLLKDFKSIRRILLSLLSEDSVGFCRSLPLASMGGSEPLWMASDHGEALVREGASRREKVVKACRERAKDEGSAFPEEDGIPGKWRKLLELVESIIVEAISKGKDHASIVVVCQSEGLALRLQRLLEEGTERWLLHSLRQSLNLLPQLTQFDVDLALERTQSTNLAGVRPISPSSSGGGFFCPRLSVVSLEGSVLSAALCKKKPDYLVVFELSLPVMRQVELYAATRAEGVGGVLEVFLLVTPDRMLDEQSKFKEHLKSELLKWDAIIESRSRMVLPPFQRRKEEELDSRQMQKGGKERVVVDTRELRSQLPFELYKQRLQVEVATLIIGDYVVSRDICIERKSLPDLLQSLSSGRLFRQGVNLCAGYYLKPSLLIEFEGRWGTPTGVEREMDTSQNLFVSRMVVLCLHFPSLSLLWSPSVPFSSRLIKKMKKGREQPSVSLAVNAQNPQQIEEERRRRMGGEGGGKRRRLEEKDKEREENTTARTASQPQAIQVLSQCPGVSAGNLLNYAGRGRSLADLVAAEEEVLKRWGVGERDARKWRRFCGGEGGGQGET